MAKKGKNKLVGGGAEAYSSPVMSFSSPTIFDNNPDGPSNLPNDDINGCYYKKGKIFMGDAVAAGEGKKPDNALLQTANGSQYSRGQNPDQQRNWSPDSSWSEDKEWKGGNLTGV